MQFQKIIVQYQKYGVIERQNQRRQPMSFEIYNPSKCTDCVHYSNKDSKHICRYTHCEKFVVPTDSYGYLGEKYFPQSLRTSIDNFLESRNAIALPSRNVVLFRGGKTVSFVYCDRDAQIPLHNSDRFVLPGNNGRNAYDNHECVMVADDAQEKGILKAAVMTINGDLITDNTTIDNRNGAIKLSNGYGYGHHHCLQQVGGIYWPHARWGSDDTYLINRQGNNGISIISTDESRVILDNLQEFNWIDSSDCIIRANDGATEFYNIDFRKGIQIPGFQKFTNFKITDLEYNTLHRHHISYRNGHLISYQDNDNVNKLDYVEFGISNENILSDFDNLHIVRGYFFTILPNDINERKKKTVAYFHKNGRNYRNNSISQLRKRAR